AGLLIVAVAGLLIVAVAGLLIVAVAGLPTEPPVYMSAAGAGAGTAIGDRPEQQKLPGCGRSPDRATCLHESSGRGQETGPSYMKRETGPSDRYNILAAVACGWQGCGLHFLQQHSLALEGFYCFLPVGGSFAAIRFNLLINVPINVAVAGVPIFAIP